MIWFLFILFEVGLHFFWIEVLKKRPRYDIVRTWRFGWACVFLFWYHPEFDPLGDKTTIFPAATYLIFQVSSFYLLFDPLLNIARNKPIDYRGKKSGLLDPHLSDSAWWILKGVCLFFTIMCIIGMYGQA